MFGFHPGMPQTHVMDMIIGMDAGHDTSLGGPNGMDESTSSKGRILAFRWRQDRLLVNEHCLVTLANGDRLWRFRHRQ